MAAQSYPTIKNIFDIASVIECEAGSLKAGLSLVNDTLQFSYADADQVSIAQDHLYFLAGALERVQERLQSLAADAYLLHHEVAGKAAGVEAVASTIDGESAKTHALLTLV